MNTITIVLGGIGLFLLGMILMTDGLKELAGESLKKQLSKFTGGLFSSILSGTFLTAVLQSSSATTLMTIGFVSAGLLSFAQAIGVILGANLGSTSIGWIVSFVGLKVSVSAFALPLIGIGALLRFLTNNKYTPYGIVFAGFGLLFLGIGTLQDGMAGLAESFSLEAIGGNVFIQYTILFLIGIVMTIVMQSSSTAMVITLTALAADALAFEQAAVLVIGQNIGTTAKAFFVTLGGTIQARRTAMTHIFFNILTALVAFIFLPWILSLVKAAGRLFSQTDWTILLALFSTVIYILGIAVLIPFMTYFIKFIEYIVPEKEDKLTKYLDASVATVPSVAIEAVRRTLIRVTKMVASIGMKLVQSKTMTAEMRAQLQEVEIALSETRHFLSSIDVQSQTHKEYLQHVSLIHTIDHLGRLIKTLNEPEAVDYLNHKIAVQGLTKEIGKLFQAIYEELTYDEHKDILENIKEKSLKIADIRRTNRKEIIEKTALRQADVSDAIQKVHKLHWIDRTAYHLWRGMHHLHMCIKAEEGMGEEDHNL